MIRFTIAALFSLTLLLSSDAHAGLQRGLWLKGMRVVDSSLIPQMSPLDHYKEGMSAFKEHHWDEARYHFRIITHNFSRSRWAPESYFRQGMSELFLGEFESANELLSHYLKSQGNPEYFTFAVEAKYHIAEQFRLGKKRRMFSQSYMPKLAGGEMQALDIYDEVTSLVPCERLAAKSYYSKGKLLEEISQIKEAVHSYQTVIRHFPKDELAISSYIAIAELYRRQSELEFQNPDLLELAKINSRRFEIDFPKDPRVGYVKALMLQTEEIHAHGLYETGRIYERKSLPDAAVVYYDSAMATYPDTKIAELCRNRLIKMGKIDPIESSREPTEEVIASVDAS